MNISNPTHEFHHIMVWCKEDVATISLRYMINDQLGKGEKHCCYEKGRGRQKKKKKEEGRDQKDKQPYLVRKNSRELQLF